jgi:predicted enzyme related to lactoylglutathione lyase
MESVEVCEKAYREILRTARRFAGSEDEARDLVQDYAEALGLDLTVKDGYLLGTLSGGTELVFFEGEAARGTSPQVVFGLDEGGIDTAAEALVARGVQLLTPVSEAPGGWSVEFKDPDGHPLAFFQAEALPRRL